MKNAAMKCFAKAGYPEASIAAITGEAGVAHGTFYVHFPSKDALLDELLAEFNTGLVARLAPIWTSSDTDALPEQLEATAGAFLDYWSERREFVETYAQKVAQGISITELREGLAAVVAELLVQRLRSMVDVLEAPLPHAELVVQSLLAMWARVGLHHLFTDRIDREQAVGLLTRMTLGALRELLPPGAIQ